MLSCFCCHVFGQYRSMLQALVSMWNHGQDTLVARGITKEHYHKLIIGGIMHYHLFFSHFLIYTNNQHSVLRLRGEYCNR